MSTGRTTNVSSRTPKPIMNANSRKPSTGTSASIAKEAARAMPATLIAREARGAATAIASQGPPLGLLPDAPRDEDVVVGAERDQQHAGGEGDVVGQVAVAEEALEEVRRHAERRRDGEHARRKQVERRDESAQEEREQEEVAREDDRADERRAVHDRLHGVGGDRRLAGQRARGRARLLDECGEPLVESLHVSIASESSGGSSRIATMRAAFPSSERSSLAAPRPAARSGRGRPPRAPVRSPS